jgi:hypothetical protein
MAMAGLASGAQRGEMARHATRLAIGDRTRLVEGSAVDRV